MNKKKKKKYSLCQYLKVSKILENKLLLIVLLDAERYLLFL